MNLADIRRRVLIAKRSGLQVSEADYGWTTGCRSNKEDVALVMTEVYRQERDGYIGGKMIALDLLREWVKKHK